MKYNIIIEIGTNRYDGIKSEAQIDAENLHPVTLEQIVKAMVFDAEKKALRKFSDIKPSGDEPEPPAAPEESF